MTTHLAAADPRIGSVVLGRYRLVRYLATGGMGAIYLARAEGAAGFVRPVVIKRSLRVGDDQAGRMFAREARILSRLRHPGIVSILDFAEDEGDYVMVLEYVHGYSLSEWAKYLRKSQRGLPVEIAVHVALRVLEALQYAHTMRDPGGEPLGIVHRDVKPSNVLIDVQGDVKLADFGIARTDTDVTEVSVSDNTLKGTFPYMAPELFARAKPNAATDVYSAALTLYSILSGTNPFSSADVAMTVGRVLHHEPEPLHVLRNDVPESLAWVVATGMSKLPELRYSSAAIFAEALRSAGLSDSDARFRSAVSSDFGDPDIGQLLGVDSLSDRAEAWSREVGPGGRGLSLPLPAPEPTVEAAPPEAVPRSGESTSPSSSRKATHGGATGGHDVITASGPESGRARSVHDLPTQTGRPETTTSVIVPSRRLVVGLGVVAVGGAIAAAATTWILTSRTDRATPEPTVLVVHGDVAMEGSAAAAPGLAAPSPVDASVDAPFETRVVTRLPAVPDGRAPRPRDQDLTGAVRRRQGMITACFERHTAGAGAIPELSFRFQVDRRGVVAHVELLPESLASTPVGRCLLDVARGTRFGALAEPVTFRIPITVRRE